MEYLEVDQEMFEDESMTPENVAEAIDNAIGDRRKKRLKRRAAKKAKKAKKAHGKRKKRLLKRSKKLTGKKIRKVEKRQKRRKKIKKGLKRVGQAAVFAPLIPLKPVMLKALEKKGKRPAKKTPIGEVAKLFYNEIVTHYDDNFEPIEMDFELDNIDPVTISSLVSAIVTFIKGLKKKKKAGEPLTKTEDTIVTGTEAVEAHIQSEMDKERAEDLGGKILFDRKFQLIAAGAILILIFALRK